MYCLLFALLGIRCRKKYRIYLVLPKTFIFAWRKIIFLDNLRLETTRYLGVFPRKYLRLLKVAHFYRLRQIFPCDGGNQYLAV
jgi:hypothetical protein